ncbi:MAG TPA: (deoxy)nucleoside triphosphate pyrophosphohydrolase [Vicinamibacterales bacterium]|nr:(deoxy)nucleoside triphosphate pyrophosphohydrolase [Vicinamibacterales bacterium]
MAADRPTVVVIAGVIERDGRFLLARRLEHTHLAGYWEFPGGKCEAGETHEACLARELREELDVPAVVGDEILSTEHVYPERTVRLHFRRCEIGGDPRAQLGQELRWVEREELRTLQLPPADDEVIEILISRQDR